MTSKFSGFPVNLPYYWKVVLRAPSDVSAFTNATNELYEDLFNDVTNFYTNSSLNTSQAFRKHMFRLVTIKALPLDVYAALPSEEYRKHFVDAGFLIPHSYVLPGDPNYAKYLTGSYTQHDMTANVSGIETLTDAPDNPQVTLRSDTDYITQDGMLTFITYPFAPVKGRTPPYWQETYVAPWGDTYTVNVIRFLANTVSLSESPLYDSYGGLVYYKKPTSVDEEITYRNKILGLFLLFYRGATPHAVDACLNLMLGMPVTLHHNEVVSEIRQAQNPDGTPDMDHWEIRTSREVYIASTTLPLNEQVKVGAVLPKYTPFNAAVEVHMNTDAHNWVNGVTLPKRYLCVVDIASGTESQVTIDTETRLEAAYAPSYDIEDGVFGRVVAPAYDTPGVEPLAHRAEDPFLPSPPVPLCINPDIFTRNKYLWDAIFGPIVFKVKFNVAVDPEVISFVDTILHDIIPIWTTYLLEYIDEMGEPTLFMAGEYMDREYSESFLD